MSLGAFPLMFPVLAGFFTLFIAVKMPAA